jgi:C-terminal processing protease CtpA/Prc
VLHFYPHLQHASVDWATVLRQWIPRIAGARTLRTYYEGLLALAARLNDSHVHIFHPAAIDVLGSHTPPVALRRVEGRVAVTRTRAGAKDDAPPGSELEPGTVVTHVDGTPIAQAMKAKARFISASTPQALERDLLQWGQLLAGKPGSTVRLTVGVAKKRRHIMLKRTTPLSEVYVPRPGPPYRALEGGFGYIDLDALPSPPAVDDALHALRRTRGLILDMRGYPHFVHLEVTKHLVRQPFLSGQFLVPGTAAAHALDPEVRERWQAIQLRFTPPEPRPYLKPVVVLIDSRAQSAAEDFCIYLRNAGRATFVGTPTAGTDGDIAIVHLPGGARVSFTGMRVLYADGTPFQNTGILPDVEVAPTLKGIRAGRDEVLEVGIEVLMRLTGADCTS